MCFNYLGKIFHCRFPSITILYALQAKTLIYFSESLPLYLWEKFEINSVCLILSQRINKYIYPHAIFLQIKINDMAGFQKWEESERFTEPNTCSLPYFIMIKLSKEKKGKTKWSLDLHSQKHVWLSTNLFLSNIK